MQSNQICEDRPCLSCMAFEMCRARFNIMRDSFDFVGYRARMIANKAGKKIFRKVDVNDAPEPAADDEHMFPELACFVPSNNRFPMLPIALNDVRQEFDWTNKEKVMERLKSECGSDNVLFEHICRMCTPYRADVARHLCSRLHLEREYTEQTQCASYDLMETELSKTPSEYDENTCFCVDQHFGVCKNTLTITTYELSRKP